MSALTPDQEKEVWRIATTIVNDALIKAGFTVTRSMVDGSIQKVELTQPKAEVKP